MFHRTLYTIAAIFALSVTAFAQEAVPGELLVQFRVGATATDKARALGKANARALDNVLRAANRRDGKGDLILVSHPLNNGAKEALASDPAVEFAEPNWIYTHNVDTNDEYFVNGSLWGIYGNYGSNAAAAWSKSTGSSNVYVGVIDEGIQLNHPDLLGQVWVNPYDPPDGIDNDGNGYVDDINGWDFDGNNNTIYDGGTKGSADNHGTHVSGTIGGKANNNIGVVGVNWSVTLISGKFLGRRGGTTANAVKAVDYFTDLKTRHGLNIVATNNSWGGGGFSQALYDAISRANVANILFIAAAGNGDRLGRPINIDSKPSYPASYTNPNLISVAAIDVNGAMAYFSNYGATSVDLGAPGVSIISTVAYNNYSSYSGTSMATPHVTGAVALYAARTGETNAATIKAAILSGTTPTASLAGKCVTGGRLNVDKSVPY